MPRPTTTAFTIGHDDLGPILVEFAQRLWLFQHTLPARDDACLLFCARGGLRLRLVYERVLARTGLTADVPYADLMIARLVAARTAFATPGPALRQELTREFEGQTMGEVITALTQDPTLAMPAWHGETFDADRFFTRLAAATPEAETIRARIATLDAAFRRHLDHASAGRRTLILCDTGLYGSTLRLLQEGVPDRTWLAAQFARSNYKRFDAPHFAVTAGLSVEHDGYAPWNARTSVLRFWHLIESLLEPNLASVRTFTDDPLPRANLEVPGWQDRVAGDGSGPFGGVLAYIDGLSPRDLARVTPNAEAAWLRLRRRILWPRSADIAALMIATPRGRDFGRDDQVETIATAAPILSSLWREGAAIARYPRFGLGAQVLLEAAQIGRGLRRMLKRG